RSSERVGKTEPVKFIGIFFFCPDNEAVYRGVVPVLLVVEYMFADKVRYGVRDRVRVGYTAAIMRKMRIPPAAVMSCNGRTTPATTMYTTITSYP
ncbi:MAG: hypothetical protein LBE17_01015, partial [Treponema sp.]|nr:hypothetical protein [Treponema sp.]